VEDRAPEALDRVRHWDLAASETPRKSSARRAGDPDWTAGLLLGRSKAGVYYVEDVARFRASPGEVEQRIREVAERDGRVVRIEMEQEGGASGKSLVSHYRRNVLDGFAFRGVTASGSKEMRAAPVAARAEHEEVVLVDGEWVEDFLDEVCEFPEAAHDDQVDALSGAFASLAKGAGLKPVKPTGFKAGSHWTNA
jgi:predicted phage terminase large subunit-like protein